jgi:hypothetical protein
VKNWVYGHTVLACLTKSYPKRCICDQRPCHGAGLGRGGCLGDLAARREEEQCLLEIGRIVDPSLSLRNRWGEAQERNDEGLGWGGDEGWDGKVRELVLLVNVEQVRGCRRWVDGGVSRDAARTLKTSSSSWITSPVFLILCRALLICVQNHRIKPCALSSQYHNPQHSTLPATLVANCAVQDIISLWHLNSPLPFQGCW